MNKSIIADRLFRLWVLLPTCQIYRRRHFKDVRSRFHYETEGDISIFCTNCVGGELYYLLKLKFGSPLINTTMVRKDFITLCENLPAYMACDLILKENPGRGLTGTLGDGKLAPVKIGFPHDADPKKAKENWERRVQRINYEKLVLICDDQGVGEEEIKRFEAIPAYRKILFTKDDRKKEHPVTHKLPGYENLKETGDYNGKSLKGLWKFTEMWDYVSFLNGDET